MRFPDEFQVDQERLIWTDKLVRVKPGIRPELKRFEGKVGRVMTINYSGRAVIDFADGAWYDLADFESILDEVTDEAERTKYDPTANSAQPFPTRQA